MNDKVIGYLIGALDGDEQNQLEQMLAADEKARATLDAVRRRLTTIHSCCCNTLQIPSDLAVRTCSRVREVTLGAVEGKQDGGHPDCDLQES